MTCSELSPTECKFLELVTEAREHDPVSYIVLLAILCCDQPDAAPFGDYSNGLLRSSTKRLRELQKEHPKHASSYEEAILYIRREILNKKAVVV